MSSCNQPWKPVAALRHGAGSTTLHETDIQQMQWSIPLEYSLTVPKVIQWYFSAEGQSLLTPGL